MLDAGLLAEVYIQMTRGQESLVIEEEEAAAEEILVEKVDLAAFTLPVLLAEASELAAHEAVLADLDKSSNGKTLWRTVVA